MGTTTNVVVGPGQFFIAPETVAIPTLSGNATDFAAFDVPGYTEDGIELDHNTTDKEIRVDEESDPIDVTIDKESNMMTLKLAEATLQNLYYAIAGATYNGTDTITFGGANRPNIFRAAFLGPGPRDPVTLIQKQRQLILYRVYSKSALKIHYRRNDKIMYQCQFVALADSTQPIGARTGIYKDF